MVALGVVVLLLWVVAPVLLYQIGRFTYALTQPRSRRVRLPRVTVPMPAAPEPRKHTTQVHG